MRVRAPGRTWETVTFSSRPSRVRRCAAAAAVLLLTVSPAAASGGPDTTPATPPTPVAAPAGYDDTADLVALRREYQRASRDRRRAEEAAAAAVVPAAVVVKRTTRRAAPATPKRAPATARARRTTTVPVLPADGSRASTVIGFAVAQVGKPYIWAASGPRGYDCSGLLLAAFARVGIRLPHKSGSIAGMGRPVPRGQWAPGDVLYWPGHVALYLGGGRMVHAPGTGRRITIASVYGSPGARRLV